MIITVETLVKGAITKVWYSNPEDIKQRNSPFPDWHPTSSTVDLREGGLFSSRMKAKDGRFGLILPELTLRRCLIN
jgi:uncharacterized protein YndB with AHSA1/START domain